MLPPLDLRSSAPGTAHATAATDGSLRFFALACALTWLLATPAALAWLHHQAPPPHAIACAGLSAFGPSLAALAVAGSQKQLGAVFGRWRTSPLWIGLALVAPLVLHTLATTAYVVVGGHPAKWFYPPVTPEHVAALVVFPIGEEFGWRGFLQPRMVRRHGVVRGSLIVGLCWGLWHLAYSITPDQGAFDPVGFAMIVIELPFYALLVTWVFERSNRSMAVAIAFHAGAHLDNFERAPRTDFRLQALHLAVVILVAAVAAWSLSKPRSASPSPG